MTKQLSLHHPVTISFYDPLSEVHFSGAIMYLIKYLKLADIFTVANLSCGILSIIMSIERNFGLSALLLFIAVIFDVLDGKIAGLMHQRNSFGKQIDSMSDLVSFGVAPMLLFYALQTPAPWVSVLLLFFVTCGMLRLARYNVSEAQGFEGVPITVNGVLFPVLFLVYSKYPASLHAWPLIILIQGLLMISTLKMSRIF